MGILFQQNLYFPWNFPCSSGICFTYSLYRFVITIAFCFQDQQHDCCSTTSLWGQSRHGLISDREDCSRVLHTPGILCTLVVIASSRYKLRKAAQIPMCPTPAGTASHRGGYLHQTLDPWRPCSPCRVSSSVSNSMNKTGDIAKCVLREGVTDLERLIISSELTYKHSVLLEYLGIKLHKLLWLFNFCMPPWEQDQLNKDF